MKIFEWVNMKDNIGLLSLDPSSLYENNLRCDIAVGCLVKSLFVIKMWYQVVTHILVYKWVLMCDYVFSCSSNKEWSLLLSFVSKDNCHADGVKQVGLRSFYSLHFGQNDWVSSKKGLLMTFLLGMQIYPLEASHTV